MKWKPNKIHFRCDQPKNGISLSSLDSEIRKLTISELKIKAKEGFELNFDELMFFDPLELREMNLAIVFLKDDFEVWMEEPSEAKEIEKDENNKSNQS